VSHGSSIEARAFAPASVGNVGVGFDILGHAIEGVGDTVTVRRIAEPVVRIHAIRGTTEDLPRGAEDNTAGAALIALRAALVAANALLPQPLSREALYPFALTGEAVASGGRHGDNLGPMLLGGLVLSTADRLVPVPVPAAWHSLLVHPNAVLETRRARAALQGHYALGAFVAQSANLALVLSGCFTSDAALVRAGLRDVLVEPRRAGLIAGFAAARDAALNAGAMGASISGAGPSVFAWFEQRDAALAAQAAVQQAFADAGFDSQGWVSPLNAPAARVL